MLSPPHALPSVGCGVARGAAASAGSGGPRRQWTSDNGQATRAALVGRNNDAGDTRPNALTAPASPWTLHAGSIIAASLITGLNSDLPGLVTAQVTQNVYDSVTGRSLLIPQGSRLIGSYDRDRKSTRLNSSH